MFNMAQLPGIMRVDSNAIFIMSNVQLYNGAPQAAYTYSAATPFRSTGLGVATWPSLVLAPNATVRVAIGATARLRGQAGATHSADAHACAMHPPRCAPSRPCIVCRRVPVHACAQLIVVNASFLYINPSEDSCEDYSVKRLFAFGQVRAGAACARVHLHVHVHLPWWHARASCRPACQLQHTSCCVLRSLLPHVRRCMGQAMSRASMPPRTWWWGRRSMTQQ
jgi:hypothetical protein